MLEYFRFSLRCMCIELPLEIRKLLEVFWVWNSKKNSRMGLLVFGNIVRTIWNRHLLLSHSLVVTLFTSIVWKGRGRTLNFRVAPYAHFTLKQYKLIELLNTYSNALSEGVLSKGANFSASYLDYYGRYQKTVGVHFAGNFTRSNLIRDNFSRFLNI